MLPYRSLAFETTQLLRGEPILAAKELISTHCQLLVETSTRLQRTDNSAMTEQDYSLQSKSKWWDLVKKLRKVPHVWREARAAMVVMLVQQLCGINVLVFYSSSLFCNTDVQSSTDTSRIPLWLSFGLGGLNFLCAIPAYWLIESHGRRWLLLSTLPLLFLCLAAAVGPAGSPMLSDQGRQAAVTTFTYVFVIIYSFGVGPVPFTYSAEIFQLEQRMVGMSWAVSVNFLSAGLLTFFVPVLIAPIRPAGLLGIFAVLNIIAWVLVLRLVPETVGPPIDNDRSKRKAPNLEGMFHLFERSLKQYWAYEQEVYMPYVKKWWYRWFRTHVLGLEDESVLEMPRGYIAWLQKQVSREWAQLEEDQAHINRRRAELNRNQDAGPDI